MKFLNLANWAFVSEPFSKLEKTMSYGQDSSFRGSASLTSTHTTAQVLAKAQAGNATAEEVSCLLLFEVGQVAVFYHSGRYSKGYTRYQWDGETLNKKEFSVSEWEMELEFTAEEMPQKPFVLLNTSILTCFGEFSFTPASLEEVKEAISKNGLKSAIGHESTAEILTELLEEKVEANRISYSQQPGETAIVFKLKSRAAEGSILSRQQIEELGYEFGFLTRKS